MPPAPILSETFTAMPTLLYKRLPSRRSHCSPPAIWTRNSSQSTSPINGPITSPAQFTARPASQTEELNRALSTDDSALVDDAVPLEEATRPTPDVSNEATLSTLSSTKPAPTIDVDRCLTIIQVLQDSFFEIQTFNDVTPEELQFIAYERRNYLYPKQVLILLRIVAMSPLPAHECPPIFFTDCVRALVTPYSHPGVTLQFHPNSAIQGQRPGEIVIPDFRLDIRPRRELGFAVWVGECAFTQTRADAEAQLAQAVLNAPQIDTAFLISFNDATPNLPRRDVGHAIFSQPRLPETVFRPTGLGDQPITTLHPVIVNNVTWVSIKAVDVFVFLRGDDGKFSFRIDEGNPLAAHGTLHPVMAMQNVKSLLDIASKRLLCRIADTVETHHNVEHAHSLRHAAETVRFPVDWTLFLEEIQLALYATALTRYTSSYNGENVSKRKESSSLEAGPSNKRPAPPLQPSNPGGSRKKSGRKKKQKGRREANAVPDHQDLQGS
ncbi:hypothetical protein L210DRAFT_3767198 [Boletus edulis BED1]|uniref:Uncharacterized protein n=2 Tax=Boletus edulis BED1 TaxID=1328754 RepID=A0AAD4G6V6_BOLED|nr:hypothetical protein L210DRAFT_3767198 [Boletus edulis BED1]